MFENVDSWMTDRQTTELLLYYLGKLKQAMHAMPENSTLECLKSVDR